MNYCAHCGRPFPKGTYQSAARPGTWSVHDVPHNDGTVRTVAVCPPCRVGVRIPEVHEPGSCSGHYAGADAYIAECEERDCNDRWACWDKKCVEGWQDEHYEDYCGCSNCIDGHHNTKMIQPKQPQS
jgi:hypothetical protein